MDQYSPHIEWIARERKTVFSLLQKLVNIHSGSHNLLGLSQALNFLKGVFSALEGAMEEISLPGQKVLTSTGEFIKKELGKTLVIRKHERAKIQILLVGHMDIALPKETKLEKCKRKSRDILQGRGAADMKSGILIIYLALLALEKSPFAGKIGWTVVINPDEEIGSPGSEKLLRKEAKCKDLGLVFEPALPDGSLVSARKGSANFTVYFKGRPAHVGRDFSQGLNALISACRFALSADSLSDLAKDTTVNVGYLLGGGILNSVPEHAICRINLRAKTKLHLQRLKEKLYEIKEIESRRLGSAVLILQESERPPKLFDKNTLALFESLKRCGDDIGMTIHWKASGGVTDGNILADEGLLTIDTLGGIGANLHTAEEYVSIISILQRAKLVALFLMQIAAGQIAIKRRG